MVKNSTFQLSVMKSVCRQKFEAAHPKYHGTYFNDELLAAYFSVVQSWKPDTAANSATELTLLTLVVFRKIHAMQHKKMCHDVRFIRNSVR